MCGGNLMMDNGGDFAQCESCGLKYTIDSIHKMMEALKITTLKVEGKVEVQQSDFDIRSGVLVRYSGNDERVVIPDTVKEIGEGAFADCKRRMLVNEPNRVVSFSGRY